MSNDGKYTKLLGVIWKQDTLIHDELDELNALAKRVEELASENERLVSRLGELHGALLSAKSASTAAPSVEAGAVPDGITPEDAEQFICDPSEIGALRFSQGWNCCCERMRNAAPTPPASAGGLDKEKLLADLKEGAKYAATYRQTGVGAITSYVERIERGFFDKQGGPQC